MFAWPCASVSTNQAFFIASNPQSRGVDALLSKTKQLPVPHQFFFLHKCPELCEGSAMADDFKLDWTPAKHSAATGNVVYRKNEDHSLLPKLDLAT